jgi:hypothetical protein
MSALFGPGVGLVALVAWRLRQSLADRIAEPCPGSGLRPYRLPCDVATYRVVAQPSCGGASRVRARRRLILGGCAMAGITCAQSEGGKGRRACTGTASRDSS